MTDEEIRRTYMLDKAATLAAEIENKRYGIALDGHDAREFFWPEQTPLENRNMRRLMVKMGKARWLISTEDLR